MKIYEALKGVISEEQLAEFQDEVKRTIDEAVEAKTNEITSLSDEYVKQAIKEKESEMEGRLDECKKEFEGEVEERAKTLAEDYCRQKDEELASQGALTLEEFEKFKQAFYEREESLVDALNTFLNERIEAKISDKLIRETVATQETKAIVDGIKALFEEHYSGIDATAGVRKIRRENAELKDAYGKLMEQNSDLRETAERASVKLLILEKTKDLSEAQTKKVMTYFEGRDYDFVKSKINDFILLTENEHTSTERKFRRSERRIHRLDEVNNGFIPENKPAVNPFYAEVNRLLS